MGPLALARALAPRMSSFEPTPETFRCFSSSKNSERLLSSGQQLRIDRSREFSIAPDSVLFPWTARTRGFAFGFRAALRSEGRCVSLDNPARRACRPVSAVSGSPRARELLEEDTCFRSGRGGLRVHGSLNERIRPALGPNCRRRPMPGQNRDLIPQRIELFLDPAK